MAPAYRGLLEGMWPMRHREALAMGKGLLDATHTRGVGACVQGRVWMNLVHMYMHLSHQIGDESKGLPPGCEWMQAVLPNSRQTHNALRTL